jgi:hydrogenase/urease accessory protein HupE
MRRIRLAALALAFVGSATAAAAHPVPFTYLDVHVDGRIVDVTLVAHVFDVGHDLKIEPADRLLDPRFVAATSSQIVALVAERLHLTTDGRPMPQHQWGGVEPLPDRQSIRVKARYELSGPPGLVTVRARMFPYDAAHQTFVNFYEGNTIASQAILDQARDNVDYFVGTRQGVLAVVRRFVPAGIHHILIGPDHLLFLVGLLLLGGSMRRLLLVVSAFTVAHSITLSLAALNILSPPARLIEPAIALSIVYVGADNLMVRGGRDVRTWIAFVFGFIHGFGFANVLREMDLPRRALGWSLFSFNVGVEIGQLFVVVAVASLLATLRTRSEALGRRLAFVGSVVVIIAGTFWFIERVFFPGGIS